MHPCYLHFYENVRFFLYFIYGGCTLHTAQVLHHSFMPGIHAMHPCLFIYFKENIQLQFLYICLVLYFFLIAKTVLYRWGGYFITCGKYIDTRNLCVFFDGRKKDQVARWEGGKTYLGNPRLKSIFFAMDGFPYR